MLTNCAKTMHTYDLRSCRNFPCDSIPQTSSPTNSRFEKKNCFLRYDFGRYGVIITISATWRSDAGDQVHRSFRKILPWTPSCSSLRLARKIMHPCECLSKNNYFILLWTSIFKSWALVMCLRTARKTICRVSVCVSVFLSVCLSVSLSLSLLSFRTAISPSKPLKHTQLHRRRFLPTHTTSSNR